MATTRKKHAIKGVLTSSGTDIVTKYHPMNVLEDKVIPSQLKEIPLHEQAAQASKSILDVDQKIVELDMEISQIFEEMHNMEEDAKIKAKEKTQQESHSLGLYENKESHNKRNETVLLNSMQEYKRLKKRMEQASLKRSKLRSQKEHYQRMFKLQLSCIGSPNMGDFTELT